MAEINLKTSSTGVSEIDINFNTILQGQADATIPFNVDLSDGTNPVTPTSVTLTGNDLDIIIPPASSPSGVLFKTVEACQYTSYRTGDEGWRVLNGWFDYTPPANPKAFAELDYTSTSFFNVLESPLVVNGVSSTTRFVDVNGIQAFSSTGNANLVVIDKLTGLMYTRTIIAGNSWNNSIDNALSHSIVVNSVTYDDWFLPTVKELSNFIHQYAAFNSLVDTLTSVQVIGNPFGGAFFSSTTYTVSTNFALVMYQNERYSFPFSKVNNSGATFVRNARNLITAP